MKGTGNSAFSVFDVWNCVEIIFLNLIARLIYDNRLSLFSLSSQVSFFFDQPF